jgi:hypothetical protein
MVRRGGFRCGFGLLAALLIALTAAPALAAPPISATRQVLPLDAGWRFIRADVPSASNRDFDDSGWSDVTLPHSYNGSDGEDGGGYYRGPAWYRRSIVLGALGQDRLFVQFDGAALAADVYLNGAFVGRHEGGYAAFRFDVTHAARAGDNVLAVKVDNSKLPSVAPLGGDFTVFGGLYRRVFLIQTGDIHVDMLDYGGPGVYASAKIASGESAQVNILARIRNARKAGVRLRIDGRIIDAAGRTVAETSIRQALPPGSGAEARMRADIASPILWSGLESPYLYRVQVDLSTTRGRLLDRVEVPLGIRTTHFSSETGFALNGRPYPLYGVNLFHSGRPGRGLAVTDEEVRADFQILSDLGARSVRLVHFQHPPAAYDEADRLGIPIWTEIPLNGAIDPGPEFESNIVQQMRELIRQNYNHPSVVLWGLGNEIYAVDPNVNRVLRSVQAVAKEEDPSRPTIYAHCCQADDAEKATISDVIAFNRYFGWYPEQKGLIGDWADRFHSNYPAKPFLVGEYGAGASIRHQAQPPRGKIDPPGPWHPEQVQTSYHELNWPQLAARYYLSGAFVWVAFDLASDERDEGDRPGINDKGLVTYDRLIRKDAFYWYQANWSREPVLHIADRRDVLRFAKQADIKVFTNQDRVMLELNGIVVGESPVRNRIATWKGIELQPGENVIRVRSNAGGRPLTDVVRWHFQEQSDLLRPEMAGAIPGRR